MQPAFASVYRSFQSATGPLLQPCPIASCIGATERRLLPVISGPRNLNTRASSAVHQLEARNSRQRLLHAVQRPPQRPPPLLALLQGALGRLPLSTASDWIRYPKASLKHCSLIASSLRVPLFRLAGPSGTRPGERIRLACSAPARPFMHLGSRAGTAQGRDRHHPHSLGSQSRWRVLRTRGRCGCCRSGGGGGGRPCGRELRLLFINRVGQRSLLAAPAGHRHWMGGRQAGG